MPHFLADDKYTHVITLLTALGWSRYVPHKGDHSRDHTVDLQWINYSDMNFKLLSKLLPSSRRPKSSRVAALASSSSSPPLPMILNHIQHTVQLSRKARLLYHLGKLPTASTTFFPQSFDLATQAGAFAAAYCDHQAACVIQQHPYQQSMGGEMQGTCCCVFDGDRCVCLVLPFTLYEALR